MAERLFTNRLIKEKSPYLLQHAHNPVDWYPWGEEAFAAARLQDKPIFLSIGYATCHWCHVMEEESFQNLEVAHLLNETCINIKVDREENPAVDSLYMEFAQAMMSGAAGWPLNVLLTPDLAPFFAITYLQPEGNRGSLGLKQLLLRIRHVWKDPQERERILQQAGKIVDVFAGHNAAQGSVLPSLTQISEAAEMIYKVADPIYGGTKGAPKFPIGFQACFLLRYVQSKGDSRALFYVERTLDRMHRGGIYDHLGGGFSRYSVDEKWLVPHFEKMLYDNAILARAYLEAWLYTKQPIYREVVEETLTYVLRDMTDPQGGFYSAEDADSEGHEGRFYVWGWEEIRHVLGEAAHLVGDYFGVTPVGNFEGRCVLHTEEPLESFAAHHHLDVDTLRTALKKARHTLWSVREKRPHPFKDDKIVTAWNGLMIHSLIQAGMAFDVPQYVEAAVRGARFLQNHLWKGGTLLRRWREGEARFEGCLDDYAFLIQAVLTLFEADQGSEWLEWALALTETLTQEFKAEKGAFYLTNGRDPSILLRRCEFYDGAEPSGNAVHAENLLRLYQITGHSLYLEQAEDILKAAKEHIDIYPPGACYHLMALARYADEKAPTFIIALNEEETHRQELSRLLAESFHPHKAVIWYRPSDELLRDISPLCRHKECVEGKTTLYHCYKNACLSPITDWEEMKALLQG